MKKLLLFIAPCALLPAQVVNQDVVIQARPGSTGPQVRQMRIETGQVHIAGPAGAAHFFSTELGGSGPTKNAPYSAEAVTETVQTLADGNRITRKNSVTQYRDSEGRTRSEFEFQSMGRLGDVAAGAGKSVAINDPVARVHYSLDLQNKTAIKMPAGEAFFNIAAPPQGEASGLHHGPVVVTRTFERTAGPGPAILMESTASTSARGDGTKEEDLGIRNIEGVSAKGSRSIVTIPAGEVGNQQPLKIEVEKWYSDQLKTFVLTRHSDPRVGETTLRLTNIRLGEPPPALFEVPAAFTVQEPSMQMQQMRKRMDEKRMDEKRQE